MKKLIVFVLIFTINLQISAPAFAQHSPDASRQVLANCYEGMFKKISQDAPGEDFSESAKVLFLKSMVVDLMIALEDTEVKDWRNIRTLGGITAYFALGVPTMIGGVRYFAQRSTYREYKDLKSLVAMEGEGASSQLMQTTKHLKEQIDYWKTTDKLLLKSWGVIMAVLIVALIWNYQTREDFSEKYTKTSFPDLLHADSVSVFQDQLFNSSDETSMVIGDLLLKRCKELSKQSFKNVETFDQQKVLQAIDWINKEPEKLMDFKFQK